MKIKKKTKVRIIFTIIIILLLVAVLIAKVFGRPTIRRSVLDITKFRNMFIKNGIVYIRLPVIKVYKSFNWNFSNMSFMRCLVSSYTPKYKWYDWIPYWASTYDKNWKLQPVKITFTKKLWWKWTPHWKLKDVNFIWCPNNSITNINWIWIFSNLFVLSIRSKN